MGLAPGRSLAECAGATPRELLDQGLVALEHLESKGVVHRDLSPENVLWCPRQRLLTLIDFGLALTTAKLRADWRTLPIAGTAAW